LPSHRQDRDPRRLRHLLQSEPDQQLYFPERESALRHGHNLHVRSGRPTLSLANPTPSDAQNPTPIPNFISDMWRLPTAYMNQWSFGIGRELWANAGVEIQYLGSRSVHLDRSYFN